MGQIFRIHEEQRDEDLAVVKKEISATNGSFKFESPVVSSRTNRFDPECDKVKVNEIIRQIDSKVVSSLATKSIKAFADEVKAERIDGKLNATIFNFRFDDIPDDSSLKIIAHALHSSSQNAMILPTVKTSFLQELKPGRKPGVFRLEFTPQKIADYIHMMEMIIGEAQRFGNGIEIVGTIPLIPFGFAEPIINLYLENNIRAFAIDANYKDIMGNLGDFTLMLSKINADGVPLSDAFIYACNAGIPHFDADESVSNDFLSVFAYVDVLGGTFKPRGGGADTKAKVFSRDRYAYNLAPYSEIERQFGRKMNYPAVKRYNRSEQLKESLKVRNLVGVEKMKKYLGTKPAVNKTSIARLESMSKSIKVR
jgi:hypothetical protein